MAKKQAQPTITINGTEYNVDALNDQQKALVNHVLNLDQKIASSVFQLEQLQGGRTFFMTKLEMALEAKQ